MREIWIVDSGTLYEGGTVEAVFANKGDAVAFCRIYAESRAAPIREYSDRPKDWTVAEDVEQFDDCDLALRWGCYYATVKRWDVR